MPTQSGTTIKDLADRCRIHATKAELEGMYVTRNVLEVSADRLELLEHAIFLLLPLARGFADQHKGTAQYWDDIKVADAALRKPYG